jgi:3'(2'), 5'-bisphosphate nucleotidase
MQRLASAPLVALVFLPSNEPGRQRQHAALPLIRAPVPARVQRVTNPISPLDHVSLASALLPAVLAAARVEMHHFKAGVAVETKADSSPVTVADREAEAILLEGLRLAAPGVPVIAEESAAKNLSAPGSAFFLVDPLDGTRGFAKGSPEFTINIGLVVESVPVFGLVYAPALAELYVTLGPKRAVYAQLPPDREGVVLAECGFVSLHTRTPDPAALVALVSRSHQDHPETQAILARHRVARTDYISSSIKFCLIARGQADFYPRLGPTSEWDTAAGQAILAAAGGSVTTLEGAPLSYGNWGKGFRNPAFIAWAREPLSASGRT